MDYSGKYFSVVGDSISTLAGFIPEGYALYYDEAAKRLAGIESETDTWWGQIISRLGGKLLRNNSWSGSTVSYHAEFTPGSFAYLDSRMSLLGADGVKPDVIMIYMGVNDWASGTPIDTYGQMEERQSFTGSYRIMLDLIKQHYPEAEVWCISPAVSTLRGDPSYEFPYLLGGIHFREYVKTIGKVAEEKGCIYVNASDNRIPVDSLDGFHPDKKGMKMLADEILRVRGILEKTDVAEISLGRTAHKVPDGLFGHNMEITRSTFFGGLSAELLINRKFYAVDAETKVPKGWILTGGRTETERRNESLCGSNFVRLETGGVLATEKTVCCAAGHAYRLRVWACSADPGEAVLQVEVGACRLEIKVPRRPVENDGDSIDCDFIADSIDAEPGKTPESFTEQPFRVTCESGSAFIYELSLLPAENYYGMRSDVIDLLRELKPSHLRFPGGCCTDHFDWKEGLKPASERKPLDGTAKWFLFRDTFDQDPCDMGINEFMMLCRAVGAEPEYTVRVVFSEPSEAGELVEYCNGSTETHWGRVRESLGFEAFNIKRWYLGNEIYYFGCEYMEDGAKAARRCDEYVASMKEADPSILLIGGVCSDGHHDQWDRDMFRTSQTVYDEISFHCYCGTAIDTEKQDIESLAVISNLYRGGVSSRLEWAKREIFSQNWDNVRINVDEWNLTWGQLGSTLMMLADALTEHFYMKSFEQYHITQSRFFHPVNEGMIKVTPRGAALDCVGVMQKYMNLHRGGEFIEPAVNDPDLDVVATAHGDRTVVSVINRSGQLKKFCVNDLNGALTGSYRLYRVLSSPCSAFSDAVKVETETGKAGTFEISAYEIAVLLLQREE